jgi:hypothetical protein
MQENKERLTAILGREFYSICALKASHSKKNRILSEVTEHYQTINCSKAIATSASNLLRGKESILFEIVFVLNFHLLD